MDEKIIIEGKEGKKKYNILAIFAVLIAFIIVEQIWAQSFEPIMIFLAIMLVLCMIPLFIGNKITVTNKCIHIVCGMTKKQISYEYISEVKVKSSKIIINTHTDTYWCDFISNALEVKKEIEKIMLSVKKESLTGAEFKDAVSADGERILCKSQLYNYSTVMAYAIGLFVMFSFLIGTAQSIIEAFINVVGMVAGILLFIGALLMKNNEITITNKRIYGKTCFGTRVDLPVDSISSTSQKMFKTISISTASGRIAFSFIKNREEIHKCISKLLVERQNAKNTVNHTPAVVKESTEADELKKYKDLLDIGAITEEEYNAKKKQLLGL